MSDFPHLIKEAAERFPNESVAYEQIRHDSGQMRLHIQAIEIMKQFVGDVAFDEGQLSGHICARLLTNYLQIPRDSCFTTR